MIIYNFTDILLVPFPFTDQTSTKKRPTVVISSNSYNQQRPDLIIMAITSQIGTSLLFGEIIINDYVSAGLIKPSVIKPVITTIDKSLVIRKLGQFQALDCNNLKNLLQIILV